ncbi:Spindle assembly abnormal protein 6 like protein [Nosema granulosis]|uniref:Spindle assembly abnormal protein 6 like protein n=1 Tax=Nosema granulosis TaxID=83296 RepID=A0A9P6KZV5_9MICR|nr:Spindle assembly abnormal protein 6 like protein [Nosema granulosis]
MKEILFTGKIPITCSNEDIPWQMKCDITKTDELVDIRLIDTRDIFTFYVCSLTPSDFYVLKREQDLIVDYDKFIPILVKLFHGVSTNRLCALFSKETWKFMFVEKSEFRNIVRLELSFLKPDESHYKRYLSDIISRMESDNIRLIKENGMLKEQCLNGDKQMKDRMGYLEEELSSHKTKIERLYKESDRLTNENYNKGMEIKDLKNKVLSLEKENTNLSYDVEKAKLEIVKNKNFEEKNKEIEKEVQELRKEIDTANEIIRKMREENLNLKTSLEKHEDSGKGVKNENKKLKSELDDLKKKYRGLEEKSRKNKEDLKQKEAQIKQLENENQGLSRRLENAQSVYNHFYSKNIDRNTFSEDSSGYSIHPESPP